MPRAPEPPTSRPRRRHRDPEPEADPGCDAEADPQPKRHAAHRDAPKGGAKARSPRPPRRPPPAASTPAFERGARVSVLRGPFEGRIGVVQEVDGKGGARVMLGLLAVRLDVTNLAAVEGRGRPRLSSSHRKPLSARTARS